MRRHLGWLLGAWPGDVVEAPRGPAGLKTVRTALRRLRPALVHAHGYRAAALASAAGARPVVVTAHGLPPCGPAVALAGRPARWLAVSWAVAAALRRAGVPAQRLVRLPPACEAPLPGPPQAVARVRWGVPQAVPVVAAMGRFAPEKGFDVLLRALPPAAWLILAGEGPLGPVLMRLAMRLGVAERVRWPGWLDAAGAAALWAAADVGAVPSRREGLGLVALEALAAGRPVVASHIGGLPEVVRPGAWGELVPPADARALGAALADLFGDPRRRWRYGVAGAEYAAGLPPARLVAATTAVYRDALGLRPARERPAESDAAPRGEIRVGVEASLSGRG